MITLTRAVRVTRIYDPEDALNNSFVKPYVPWMNMPAVMSAWQQRIPNLHFVRRP